MPQSLARIYTHSAFSTKDRAPLLTDATVRSRLYTYIRGVCRDADSPTHMGMGRGVWVSERPHHASLAHVQMTPVPRWVVLRHSERKEKGACFGRLAPTASIESCLRHSKRTTRRRRQPLTTAGLRTVMGAAGRPFDGLRVGGTPAVPPR
jgi:hypothetical protein